MRQIRYYIQDPDGNVLWEVWRKSVKNPHRTKEYRHMVFLLNRAPNAPLVYGYEHFTKSAKTES